MRYVYATILILFLGLMLIFAVQNIGTAELQFLRWRMQMPLAALIVGAYVIGMISGWSVLGFLRQSIQKVRVHD